MHVAEACITDLKSLMAVAQTLNKRSFVMTRSLYRKLIKEYWKEDNVSYRTETSEPKYDGFLYNGIRIDAD